MLLDTNLDENATIRIKVIGVGGAGSNIVDRLALSTIKGVDLAIVNSDQQALSNSPVGNKFCIGKSVTGGLGAGGDVEAGREAALADDEVIDALVANCDLVFLVAGLGGGTGTGATPVIAERALRNGAVVIAFVALPFTIERAVRANLAQEGMTRLRDVCNAVIPLPNDLLIQESDSGSSLLDAFSKADAWIERAVVSISMMMNKVGLINLDFAQLRLAFSHKAGKTLFGLGNGKGEDAADKAIEDFKLCPLLHTPEFSKTADFLLVNIVGGAQIGISDTQKIMESVVAEFGAEANVAMGAVVDEDLGDQVEICVIGTSDVSDVPVSRYPKKKRATRTASHAAVVVEAPTPVKAERGKPIDASTNRTHERKKKVEQEEFVFSNGDPKGEFENSPGTIFEGQDLDTPTYLRRGVKIVL